MRRLMQNAAATDGLYIGQPTSAQRSGSDGLLFARRLLDRDGSLGGMVPVSVAPRYFTAGYNEALFMKNGFMGIVGRDGVARLTRTGETVHAPQSPALVAAPRFARLTGNAFLAGDEWFSDKRSRYVGWHAVQAYPLIAMAGLEQQEVLAPYRAKRAASIHDAVLATLTLAAFALIAMVLSLRLVWRKHQLDLRQQFDVAAPNEMWVTDITYIRTHEGWLFLAAVLDLFSRQVIGWSMGPRMDRDLALNALLMVVWRRKPEKTVMVHSDQGSQFSSYDWQTFLKAHNLGHAARGSEGAV
jgi:hypothetical protein